MNFQPIDYFASIDWMRYKGEWIPKEIHFKPTYNKRKTHTVRISTESLTEFSYEDIVQSQVFYPFPWCAMDDDTEQVQVGDLKSFLNNEDFFESLGEGEWELIIAAKDAATFMFLEPVMPFHVILRESNDDLDTLVAKYANRKA